MTDGAPSIPIGPIVGAAVGLGLLAATAKITRDALDHAKEHEYMRQHPMRRNQPIREHQQFTPHPTEKHESVGFNIDAKINRMLGR